MFVIVIVIVIVHSIARAGAQLVRAVKIIAIVIIHIIARAEDPVVRALKIIAQAGDVILPISINRIIGRALKSSRTTILGKMLRQR